MLVSYLWLKEFIAITKSPDEIAHMLTMAGLEVESLLKETEDTLFDISVTPNRGDCLSVLGIARELSAITGKRIKYQKIQPYGEDVRPHIKAKIDNRDLCKRYTGRVMKGVRVGQSPEWLKKRLASSGIRAVNNIVDSTNYVMLELGQPLHAFDFDRLKAKQVRAAVPPKEIKFRTLDGVERQVSTDMLLIWDGENPVAIAGIMGGEESEVGEETKNIFLESACFDALSIRKSSSLLGIRTESSLRFERGIDILHVDKALDRASYLIAELAGGSLCRKVDVFPKKYSPRFIKLNYGAVNDLLGVDIPNARIHDLLLRIGAQVEDSFNYFHVEVPSHRNDLEKDVDLIEEVARLYGYHKIVSNPPLSKIEARHPDRKRKKINAARQAMVQKGYSEVINFSSMNQGMIDALKIGQDDVRNRSVCIMNPLRQEESLMRTTLIPSLINNLIYNLNRGMRTIKFFEVSNVYFRKQGGGKLPVENLRLGGLSLVEKMHQLWNPGVDDFFTVKGDVEACIRTLTNVEGVWRRSDEPFLHPGKSADFVVKDRKAGFVGVLSPDVVSSLDFKVQKGDVVLFELDMDMLLSLSSKQKVFQKFSIYPYIQRDLSVLVDEGRSAGEVRAVLKSFKSELIDDIKIFDFYRGKNIPADKTSIAFTVTYRSFDRTLNEEEIDDVHQKLIAHLVEHTGAELRS